MKSSPGINITRRATKPRKFVEFRADKRGKITKADPYAAIIRLNGEYQRADNLIVAAPRTGRRNETADIEASPEDPFLGVGTNTGLIHRWRRKLQAAIGAAAAWT